MTSEYLPAHRRPSRAGWMVGHGRALAVALCAASALALVGVVLRPASVEPTLPRVATGGAPDPLPVVRVGLPAAEVLRSWDQRRAEAYATGSVRALRSLYVPGSEAGTADAALLREYLRRDLRVEGMRMQLLRVEVVEQGRHRWVIRVTDRLHGAVAVGDANRVPLPRDEATTRWITLRREDPRGPWRVASVS